MIASVSVSGWGDPVFSFEIAPVRQPIVTLPLSLAKTGVRQRRVDARSPLRRAVGTLAVTVSCSLDAQ